MEPRDHEYRNTTGLTLSLIACLAAFVVLTEVGIWSNFLEIDLLRYRVDVDYVPADWMKAEQRRQAIVSGLILLTFVASGAVFLFWLNDISRNARALGAKGMRFGPLVTMALFFVPGLHLWKPLEAIKELFRASSPEHIEDWRRASAPHLLSLWWTLWLLYQGTMLIALRADLWARTPDELLTAAWLSTVSGVVAAPLGVATCLWVWRLHALQRRRYHNTATLRVRRPWPTRGNGDPETAM